MLYDMAVSTTRKIAGMMDQTISRRVLPWMSAPRASGGSVSRRRYLITKKSRKPWTIRKTATLATSMNLKRKSMSAAWLVASGRTWEAGVTMIHQLTRTNIATRIAETRVTFIAVT